MCEYLPNKISLNLEEFVFNKYSQQNFIGIFSFKNSRQERYQNPGILWGGNLEKTLQVKKILSTINETLKQRFVDAVGELKKVIYHA